MVRCGLSVEVFFAARVYALTCSELQWAPRMGLHVCSTPTLNARE